MSFTYNENKNMEMDTDDIKKGLLEDGGLCPSCSKRIESNSLLASYGNNDGLYYYLICMKCVNMLNKLDDHLRDKKKINIEENLNNNIHIYAAILMKNENYISEKENRDISVLKNFKAVWNQDDEKYFSEHPKKKFRARKIFLGELEETYTDNPHLKNDASQKGITFAIIHHLGNEQNLKSFVNDISSYPYDDESFIAALFIVLVQKIPIEKLNDIYEDIKERKVMFDGLESFKTFY